MHSLHILLVTGLLCVAAWRDLTTRTIPDAVCLLLVSIGVVVRAAEGWQAAGLSLVAALLLFCVLLLVAMRGVLGGGDVKLASAVALGLSPTQGWDFVYVTAMIGGVLGVAYLAGPHLTPRLAPIAGAALPRRLIAVEAWRLRRRGPVPYGIAIAGGGILVLLALPGH
ncbi:prepilin peptidase [Siccirubricoccus sp. KC 17139]|uniref:Prepilin peptidase n=1 Tax=Siccirubricoccus soli TaxID=2899147 RepID=A0ABT1DBA5_9PROT|nr:prepilin peptidase [Siccirubricoccus soli]MCP2685367.1 prepilin peptidase [Siccirubricoccus soli]